MKKKFLRVLGLGLVVLPCMLAMTACSKNGSIVNIKGNYAAITDTAEIAETKTYLNTAGSKDFENMTGVRMKMTLTSKVQGEKMEMKMDAYCTLQESQLKMKILYDIQGIQVKMFADNDFIYMDMLGQKTKTDTPAEISDIIGSSTGSNGLLFSPSALLDSLNEIENNSLTSNAVIYSKSVSGATTKIQIKLNNTIMEQESYSKYSVYFVFENDEFQGMQFDLGLTSGQDYQNVTMEFAKYDGSVKMPSASELNKYIYAPPAPAM